MLHLAMNVVYVVKSFITLVWNPSLFGIAPNLGMTTLMYGFCLAGIPLILCGLFGVRNRMEPHVRAYWYYLVLAVALDMSSLLQPQAESFACGAFRVIANVLVGAVLIIQLYCVYGVWSYCEDLKEAGCGAALTDLFVHKDEAKRQRRLHIESHAPCGYPDPPKYAAASSMGIASSSHIFGDKHEMTYPPPM